MKLPEKRILMLEISFVILIFVLTNILTPLFHNYQTAEKKLTSDALQYAKIYQDIKEKRLPEADQPFVYRLGVPFLATLMPTESLVLNFTLVNMIASVLGLALFVYWIHQYVANFKARLFLEFFYICAFISMTRRVYYAPVGTDNWNIVWLLIGMICLLKSITWPTKLTIFCLSLVSFVGVFFREIILVIPLAFLFVNNPIIISDQKVIVNWKQPFYKFIPFLSGIMAWIWVQNLVMPPEGDFSFIPTAIHWMYEKSLPDYIYAWFIAFGPVIALLLYAWRNVIFFLLRNQFLFCYLLAIVVLGWIGGNATYRLIYWAGPVVFVLIGKVFDWKPELLKRISFWVILLPAQLLSQRVFLDLPVSPNDFDYDRFIWVVLTPLGTDIPIFEVIGLGTLTVRVIALAQYLLLTAGIIIYLSVKEKKVMLQP